jgi:hypothetical protein
MPNSLPLCMRTRHAVRVSAPSPPACQRPTLKLLLPLVVPDAYSPNQLRLFNRGTLPLAFKIKTTNPKQYFVRPSQGIVNGGEKVVIDGITSPILLQRALGVAVCC